MVDTSDKMVASGMGSASCRAVVVAVVFVMFAVVAMVEGQAPGPAPASTGYDGYAPGPAPATYLRGYPVGAPAYPPASSSGAGPAPAYAPAAPFMLLGVTCVVVSLTLL